MRYLPSLPEDPQIWDALARFPKGAKPLFLYIDMVMRGPSPLSIGQRELIGVLVSKLNASEFCVNAHAAFASAFGIANEVLEVVATDISSAPVDESFKPILHYVRKLTLNPRSVEESDVTAILDAGWTEEAVFDAASVVGLFSLMNRLVRGLGVAGHEQEFAAIHREMEQVALSDRLAANEAKVGEKFYSAMCESFGIFKD